MAPIKFEEHIKDKLAEREIQPAAGSWERLNSRLDETKKRSTVKWWSSAAAAVMVLLIASVLYVSQQKQKSTPIVETAVDKPTDENVEIVNKVKKPVQGVAKETTVRDQPEMQTPPVKNTGVSSENVLVSNESSEVISEEDKSSTGRSRNFLEPVVIGEVGIAENDIQLSETDLLGILAEYNGAEKKYEDYTDAEVDALLTEAVNEIARKKYTAGIINANVLLADVEYEVDQSFRKEIFDFLKEEFIKAKTAVAARND